MRLLPRGPHLQFYLLEDSSSISAHACCPYPSLYLTLVLRGDALRQPALHPQNSPVMRCHSIYCNIIPYLVLLVPQVLEAMPQGGLPFISKTAYIVIRGAVSAGRQELAEMYAARMMVGPQCVTGVCKQSADR